MLSNSRIHYQSGRHGPGIMSVETLCDLTCFDASSSCVFGKKGFDAAFENKIIRTSLNYSYSRTLQIMALATVLGVPIETVYPDRATNFCLCTKMFFNLDNGVVFLILDVFGFYGLTLKAGQIAQKNSL